MVIPTTPSAPERAFLEITQLLLAEVDIGRRTYGMAFDPTGGVLAAGSEDTLFLWRWQTGELERREVDYTLATVWTDAGELLTTGFAGEVVTWSADGEALGRRPVSLGSGLRLVADGPDVWVRPNADIVQWSGIARRIGRKLAGNRFCL